MLGITPIEDNEKKAKTDMMPLEDGAAASSSSGQVGIEDPPCDNPKKAPGSATLKATPKTAAGGNAKGPLKVAKGPK